MGEQTINNLSKEEALRRIQQLEARLRQLEESQTASLANYLDEQLGDIVLITDANAHIKYANKAFYEQLGYNPDEWIGQQMYKIIHPQDQSVITDARERLKANPAKITRFRYRLIHHDGYLQWFESSARFIDNRASKTSEYVATMRNITHQHQLEQALLESESRLQLITRHINDAIVFYDMDQKVQFVTPAFERITGYSIQELYDQQAIEYIHPDDREKMRALWGKLYEELTIDADVEYRIVTKSGNIKWLSCRWSPVHDVDGELIGFVGRDVDITERKLMEQELQRNEAQLEALLNSSSDAMFSIDTGLNIITMNKTLFAQYKMMFGIELQPGDNIVNAVTDGRIRHVWKKWYHRALAGERFRAQAIEPQDEGYTLYFDIALSPIFTAGQGVTGAAVSVRDVTNYMQTEQELRRSREMYRTIIENFPDGTIALWDRDLRMKLIGGKSPPTLGIQIKDMIGKTIDEIYATRDIEPHYEHFYAALKGEKRVYDIKYKGRIARVQAIPIFEDDGTISTFMTIAQDITEQIQNQQHEMDLAIERERIEIMRNFIQSVSHEFKTPLASINMAAHMLTKTTSETRINKYYQRIVQRTSDIQKLIDVLMMTVQIDSGVNFPKWACNINQLIQYTQTDLQRLFDEAQISLSFDLDPNLPAIMGNESYLLQAITQIMDNAVRFTSNDDKVFVRTRYIEDNVIIEISDTGIGMSKAAQERVFERFYRADEARTTAGFGLGLSIAKAIVEQHKGRIEVESIINQGSTFRIVLPVQPDD